MRARLVTLWILVVLPAALALAGCEEHTIVRNYYFQCDSCTGGGSSGGGQDATIAPRPDIPPVDVPVDEQCPVCLKPGLTFRFTMLQVTEPASPTALKDFLTGLWEKDICAYRLNVLLQIKEAELQGDGSTRITVTAGSGWHVVRDATSGELRPTEPSEVLRPFQCVADSNPPTTIPEAHYFISDTREFTLTVQPDCTFNVDTGAGLWFHPGREENPYICSAGDPSISLPVNTIPIEGLQASGSFTNTCDAIVPGDNTKLTGCIARKAACQICAFMQGPDYTNADLDPVETAVPEQCNASYCQRHCARKLWSNFGFMTGGGALATSDGGWKVPLDDRCVINGDPGYRLAGFWSAVSVPFHDPASK